VFDGGASRRKARLASEAAAEDISMAEEEGGALFSACNDQEL